MISTATGRQDIAEVLETAVARLRQSGVDDARRDARLLLAAALGDRPELVIGYPEMELGEPEAEAFAAMVARRAAREPVSRILGRREFWSLPFRISPATLDPRPDSETLVEAVLARIPDRTAALRVLDLGTGTGCLLLALLSELPRAEGLGTDISPEAVAVARANAADLGLADRARFGVADWGSGLTGSWQAIVSNPPYIMDREIAGLAPEVARYEPRTALSGGPDGLSSYRRIVPQAAGLLAAGGLLALEIGRGQGALVESILAAAGLKRLERAMDLAGIERCVLATR